MKKNLKITKLRIKKRQINLIISLQSFTKEPIREAIYTIKRLKFSHSVKSVKFPTKNDHFLAVLTL